MAPHLIHDDTAEAKRALRVAARARRVALRNDDSGAGLSRHILAALDRWLPVCVGGYWPIGAEIDPRSAMRALASRGADLALPHIDAPDRPLRFRLWDPGAVLRAGLFGALECDGVEVVPDLMLVPLLAFDRRGVRLGQGGGYYDRTLAAWPGAMAIGCAYAGQELDVVPAGPHDVRLHLIATETGVIRTQG